MTGILDDYHEARQKRSPGRPRKAGPRHPCGKLVREPVLTEKEKRANMATAVETRMRRWAVSNEIGPQKAKDVGSPEYGYALGRLHLRGLLDTNKQESALLLEAGNRMGLDYDRYYRLTGIPSPNPKAMDMRKVRGIGGEPPSDDVRKAADRMMAIEGVLGIVDVDGKPVMSLCKRIVLRDEDASNWTPSMLGYLRRGLRALVKHYHLRET